MPSDVSLNEHQGHIHPSVYFCTLELNRYGTFNFIKYFCLEKLKATESRVFAGEVSCELDRQ